MEEIQLGGQKFTAVEVVDLTESATIPEHKVEDGYPVADHIFFQPAEFQLNLTLLESEISALKQLYESKQPTTLVCKAGVFEDVVIKELNITQGGSKNTFRAVVRVKQILKAVAKTTTIPLQDLQLTPNESDVPGGATATTPPTQEVPDAPAKEENKSWLDSILSWFGGGS
jgi:hypothetical protein